jgi:hypothetical protein
MILKLVVTQDRVKDSTAKCRNSSLAESCLVAELIDEKLKNKDHYILITYSDCIVRDRKNDKAVSCFESVDVARFQITQEVRDIVALFDKMNITTGERYQEVPNQTVMFEIPKEVDYLFKPQE